MTANLVEELRKIKPTTPLPWRNLPYKDGGREREHIDADDAYELAAANALPDLLSRIEALEAALGESEREQSDNEPPDIPPAYTREWLAGYIACREEATQRAFDQTSDEPSPGNWNEACLHVSKLIAAID